LIKKGFDLILVEEKRDMISIISKNYPLNYLIGAARKNLWCTFARTFNCGLKAYKRKKVIKTMKFLGEIATNISLFWPKVCRIQQN